MITAPGGKGDSGPFWGYGKMFFWREEEGLHWTKISENFGSDTTKERKRDTGGQAEMMRGETV
jgi:hypothetical protein